MDSYAAWLADFRRRLAQHDAGVDALARDLASRTPWTVRASGSRAFRRPPVKAGRPSDVFCEVEPGSAICFEVELPETLVRRPAARAAAGAERGWWTWSRASSWWATRRTTSARSPRRDGCCGRAGLPVKVAAIAPAEETITGADW